MAVRVVTITQVGQGQKGHRGKMTFSQVAESTDLGNFLYKHERGHGSKKGRSFCFS